MPRILEFHTAVLPGNRIEISSPELPEGRDVNVQITLEEPAPASAPMADYRPHPDYAAAESRYLEDLPQLLQVKSGRWVAYGPQGCITEGGDWATVMQECERCGLCTNHLLIGRVQPFIEVIEENHHWMFEDG
jgi:hypothetical protein